MKLKTLIYIKNVTTNEIFGALGFLSQLNLSKKIDNNDHFF